MLSGGQIAVDGQSFDSPSAAAQHVAQRQTNGWYFWLVDVPTKRSLSDVRREYAESLTAGRLDLDDDDASEDS